MRRPPARLASSSVSSWPGVRAQGVPLYTDWLWFQEVGYTRVFTTTLSLRGALFTAVAVSVLVFLYANLTFAVRTAAPDVLWELEDQLGLPGRVVIEPIIRRFLPVVVTLISLGSGLRASAHWETLLAYLNAEPFGAADPLFGRDLGFFLFTLPFWRLLYGWGMALVAGHRAPHLRALRAAAEPRPHHPGAAPGRGRALPPPGARRRAPAPPGRGVLARSLRARLLPAGDRLRRHLHRHPCLPAGPGHPAILSLAVRRRLRGADRAPRPCGPSWPASWSWVVWVGGSASIPRCSSGSA